MLNKIMLITRTIYTTFVFGMALILPLLSLTSNAREAQSIDFYLPFHSKQFPALIPKLEQALIAENIRNINIKTADYWPQYQQNIRQGRIGIYYAAPHFTAWLIHRHQFTSLVKVKNKLKYVIASKQAKTGIFEIRDLVNKDICTQSALNLDYLLVVDAFEKSLQTANANIVSSVKNEMINSNTQCSAFSISEHTFKKQQLNYPNRYIRLSQGKEYDNYAISIHPSLTADYSEKVISFLKKKSTLQILSPLLQLSSSSTELIKINEDDYPKQYTAPLTRYWRE